MSKPKTEPEYAPYGPEWEAAVMRLSKSVIISIVRRVSIERDALRETLPYREKEDAQ